MNQSTALAKDDIGKIYESLALKGDISALSAQDKTIYLQKLCESLGLNPLTQPFTPLKLNGKEILYASRGCTDQLASIHRLTREIIKTDFREDVYIVTCKASGPDGRFDISTGVVTIGGLKGDSLANALMKAETKAKRRATLSFCGLGFLDESELETIPQSYRTPTKTELVQETKKLQPVNPWTPEETAIIESLTQQLSELFDLLGWEDQRKIKALTKFVSLKTIAEKEDAVALVRREWEARRLELVKEGLASQGWEAEELDRYLAKFGIENGLNSASDEEIEMIFADMREGKMI